MFIGSNVFYDENLGVRGLQGGNVPSDKYQIYDMCNGKISIKNDENGARFTITESNLMYLMRFCSIEQFVINQDCILVKEKGRFCLIPLNSPDYQELINRNESRNVALRRGNQYIVVDNMNNEFCATYLGKISINHIHVSTEGYNDYSSSYFGPERMIFLTEDEEVKIFYRRSDFRLKEKLATIDEHKSIDYNIDYINQLFVESDSNYGYVASNETWTDLTDLVNQKLRRLNEA